jgi:polyhydroxyalkanoate synthesis regulator phasin
MEESMRDDLRRVALFTSGIAEMTMNRAEQLVQNWLHSGDLRREQAQALVRDLVEWSMQNRKELMAFVRHEIESQLSSIGVASRHDLERLERRIARVEDTLRGRAAASARKTSRRKTSAKTTARRSASKKTTRRSRTEG